MAKGNKKPQSQAEVGSRPQTTKPLEPKPTQRDNEPTPASSKSVWEGLKKSRTFYEAISVALLVAIIGVLWDRWTDEIGEHQKTTGRAERAEQRVSDLISERDQLRQLVANQLQRISDLEKLSLFLKFLGPRTKLVRSFDLPKEAGQVLDWGDCPKDQIRAPSSDTCIRFRLIGIEKRPNGVDVARFMLLGVRDTYASVFSLLLLRGCSAVFTASVYQITIAIEEVEYSSVKALIGISLGLATEEKIKQLEYGCPEK
jgi:hypothetical protein